MSYRSLIGSELVTDTILATILLANISKDLTLKIRSNSISASGLNAGISERAYLVLLTLSIIFVFVVFLTSAVIFRDNKMRNAVN